MSAANPSQIPAVHNRHITQQCIFPIQKLKINLGVIENIVYDILRMEPLKHVHLQDDNLI